MPERTHSFLKEVFPNYKHCLKAKNNSFASATYFQMPFLLSTFTPAIIIVISFFFFSKVIMILIIFQPPPPPSPGSVELSYEGTIATFFCPLDHILTRYVSLDHLLTMYVSLNVTPAS